MSFICSWFRKQIRLCRNILLCARGDLEVFGKIFPLGNPKSLSYCEEREEEDGESCPYLSHVPKDRGVLQERQQISQREGSRSEEALSSPARGKELCGRARELVPGSLSWRSTSIGISS